MKRARDEAYPDLAESDDEHDHGDGMKRARAQLQATSLVDRLRAVEQRSGGDPHAHVTHHAHLGMHEGQTTIDVDAVRAHNDQTRQYPLLGDGHMHRTDTGEIVDDLEKRRPPNHPQFVRELQLRNDMLARDPDVRFARLVQGFAHNRAPTAFIDEPRMLADASRAAAALYAKGVDAKQKAATEGPGKKTEVLRASEALLNAAMLERQQAADSVAAPIAEAFRLFKLERFVSVAPLDGPAAAGAGDVELGTGYLMPYYWRYQYRLVRRLLLLKADIDTLANWDAYLEEMADIVDYDRRVLFRNGWAATLSDPDDTLPLKQLLLAVGEFGTSPYWNAADKERRNQVIIMFLSYVIHRDFWLRGASDSGPWLPCTASGRPFLGENRVLGSWLSDVLVRAVQHAKDVLPDACLGKHDALTVLGDDPNYMSLFEHVRSNLANGKGTMFMTRPLASNAAVNVRLPAQGSHPVFVRLDRLIKYIESYAPAMPDRARFPTTPFDTSDGYMNSLFNVVFNPDRTAIPPNAKDWIRAQGYHTYLLNDRFNTLSNPDLPVQDAATKRATFARDTTGANRLFGESIDAATYTTQGQEMAGILPTLAHYEWACDVLDAVLSPVLAAAGQRLFLPPVKQTPATGPPGATADEDDEIKRAFFRLALPTALSKELTPDAESRLFRGDDTSIFPLNATDIPPQLRSGDLLHIIRYSAPALLGATPAKIKVDDDPTGGTTRQQAVNNLYTATYDAKEKRERLERFSATRWQPVATFFSTQERGAFFTDAHFLATQTLPALMGVFSQRLLADLSGRVFDLGLTTGAVVRAPIDIEPRPMAGVVAQRRARARQLAELFGDIGRAAALPPPGNATAAATDAEKRRDTALQNLLKRLEKMLDKAFDDKAGLAEVFATPFAGAGAGAALPEPLVANNALYMSLVMSASRSRNYLMAPPYARQWQATDYSLLTWVEDAEHTLTSADTEADFQHRRQRMQFWLDGARTGMQWPKLVYFLDYVRWAFSDSTYWDARIQRLEELNATLRQQWETLARAELNDRSVAEIAQDFYVPTLADQAAPHITGRLYLTPKFEACVADAHGWVRDLINPELSLEFLTGDALGGQVRTRFAKVVAGFDLYEEMRAPTSYLRAKSFTTLPVGLQSAFQSLRILLQRNGFAHGGGGGGGPPMTTTAATTGATPLFTII